MIQSDGVLARLMRAPFFLPGLLFSMLVVGFYLASVSVGGWFESLIIRAGWKQHPIWLPPVFGFTVYIGVGIVIPIWLGYSLLGPIGAIVAPLIPLLLVSVLDRW